MTVRRAILIQDIREYLYVLREALLPLLQDFHEWEGVTVDDALLWIINEEIEQYKEIYPTNHWRNHGTYSALYHGVKDALPFSIRTYTSHYIQLPKLYGDNVEISTRIINGDLYIHYTSHDQPPNFLTSRQCKTSSHRSSF